MTGEEMMVAVSEVIGLLRKSTCCTQHALSVAMLCAGAFAMVLEREENEAARHLKREADEVAEMIAHKQFVIEQEYQH